MGNSTQACDPDCKECPGRVRPGHFSFDDRVTIVSAIANHDESTGTASDPIAAALIIADKTARVLDAKFSLVVNEQRVL